MMNTKFKKYALPLLAAVTVAVLSVQMTSSLAAESAFKIPALKATSAAVVAPTASTAATETVVLAGGCFWGVQAVFQHTLGVTSAVSGYAGGSKENAHYDMVGSGATGHAESVKVTFDPRKISYGKILQIYFSVVHDPTQLNRQGPDSGTQYRSAIFYQNDDQKRVAADYIAQLDAAKVYPARIVTQLTALPATAFYPAEDYHQDFATLHPQQGYIARFDLPKLENFKQMYPADYRATPVTVFRN